MILQNLVPVEEQKYENRLNILRGNGSCIEQNFKWTKLSVQMIHNWDSFLKS